MAVRTLNCPECGQPPAMVLAGGQQAFCGSEDCHVITWNQTLTARENEVQTEIIDLGKGETDDPA